MRKLYWIATVSRLVVLLVAAYFTLNQILILEPPTPDDMSSLDLEREKISEDFYVIENNWIKKNKFGIYEMYVEGDPFERGVINGKLAKELVVYQEVAFVNQMNRLIPSSFYMNFLKYFIAFFNRDIDEYVPEEYLLEIYGISFSASDEFDYIAPKYQRILNYHGAHDIGHALQDLRLVGCTSFSVRNSRSKDSSLLVGRNFDLYLGKEFSEEKLLTFINPSEGYKFASLSWGGMAGAVSGMNEKGITVTINAGRSEIPTIAKMPISLLVREILQYASNIGEAYEIVKKREIFVSESIMVGSAADNKTVIIEKSPHKTGFYDSDEDFIICTNHFQSPEFFNDESNQDNIRESASMYRYQRVEELIKNTDQHDYLSFAEILRDQNGQNDVFIGMGNEKVLNQMVGHHSVIFKPQELKMWISTQPYQLGPYLCYDLNKIFNDCVGLKKDTIVYEEQYLISEDEFVNTKDFSDYQKYTALKEEIWNLRLKGDIIDIEMLLELIQCNPELYLSYELAGDVLADQGKSSMAAGYYEKALTKEIASQVERHKIYEKLYQCYN
jgi:hypothetical protein